MGPVTRFMLSIALLVMLGVVGTYFGQANNIVGEVAVTLLLSLCGLIFVVRLLRRSRLR